MDGFINFLIILGGLVAAGAVAVMCGVCLLVWVAGRPMGDTTEAWPPADDR